MAPAEITVDYYEYLGVTQYANDTQIKASYKRLALLYHPDKNPGSAEAVAKFQVLVDAYTILLDTDKRRVYDLSLPRIRAQNATRQKSSTRGENTARNSSTSTQEDDATLRTFQEQLIAINKELQGLYQNLSWAKKALEKGQKDLDKTLAALRKLDLEEKEDEAQEAAYNSWLGYLFTKPENEAEKDARARRRTERRVGRNVHTFKQEQREKEVDRLMRHLEKAEKDVAEKEARRSSVEWQKQLRQDELNAAKRAREEMERQKEREAAWRRQQEEEARKAQEEYRKAWEENRRKAREEREKAREAALKAQEEARKKQEETRKKQEETRKYRERYQSYEDEPGENACYPWPKKETEYVPKTWGQYMGEKVPRANTTTFSSTSTRAHHSYDSSKAQKQPQETKHVPRTWGQDTEKNVPKANATRFASATSQTHRPCQHRTWWSKVDGKNTCSSCDKTLQRFAYKCPGCEKIACAGCMRDLKN